MQRRGRLAAAASLLAAATTAAALTGATPTSAASPYASRGQVNIFAYYNQAGPYTPITANQQGVGDCHTLGAEVSSATNYSNGVIYFYPGSSCSGAPTGMEPNPARSSEQNFPVQEHSYKFSS